MEIKKLKKGFSQGCLVESKNHKIKWAVPFNFRVL